MEILRILIGSALLIVICWMGYSCIKALLEINKHRKIIIRNEEVCRYRCDLLEREPILYNRVASYDAMLESKLPLEDYYWLRGETKTSNNDLVTFGNYLLSNERKHKTSELNKNNVTHADIENWKETR